MTTNALNPYLELHIINAGIGESIIVHLPNDKWGVVDCYASLLDNPDTNPTLQFLLERQVKKLEFLCLTHPHADHYRGMSHLLKCFPIKYFWRSAAMSGEHLRNLLKYLIVKAWGDDYDIGIANDLETTFELVNQKRKGGTLSVKHMSDIKRLYPFPVTLAGNESPCDIEIWAIAPSSDHIERYQESLWKCFTKDGRLKPRISSLRHNDVSAALLFRYGRTRVVLGGDVEKQNWSDTLSVLDNAELAAHAVKVSHHGSTTGYNENLWAVFSDEGKPVAIITPYRRHGLPTREAVGHIRKYTNRLITTCRSAIPFATDFDVWENYAPKVKPAIEREFLSFHASRANKLGICSLAFDNHGNCISTKFVGAAGRL